ncbi:ferredoxin--nitrite reductase [Thermosynechococcus sp. CL-1]|uniref:ferredoxin-thioredoxin reductase catalytic domain-containing protein n=1 Tax=unclassified Thermosynechococcus TaxID=2622553 RepID=UPI00122E00EF|nr:MULTISPECIES: ferredoxin-thioredoxin reductase catalytic domain-containing protein [unclassified Thermosynechococcus]QEQ00348.1 ferredoxin--nitrite reductase [Thermosynechococcus sp. CL-1]WKT84199.1 ferredoxin-thioredoxin reductase catalytic domain-containing protein [Thermosynechococcus sp. HY596]WNC63333.1 ferredoxin-thioredoxin reductase catalytic domain-containing protein [Thermosynechococcus sp. HY591]WNC65893.1 ferredoxin-thioredoxin reductase catalytic domain-containing protein [Therm
MSSTYKPQQASDKNLEAMRKFAETYAKRTGTYFCSDLGTTAVVLEGLAKHKDDYGSPLCPCRHYEDKEAEVEAAYWNCPCVPMRERRECHCLLFLTPDHPFAGTTQEISFEQIREETNRFTVS